MTQKRFAIFSFARPIRRRFPSRTISKKYKQARGFITRHPLLSFFIALAILLFFIILGNVLGSKKVETTPQAETIPVKTYSIGVGPRLTVNAKIQKSGVIKITAQTAGVVQSINVNEGDSVAQGTQIATLSTNYQGGNAPALQTQLASVQLQNLNSTYQTQKDILAKQRDLANQQNTQASDLRDIQQQSVGETQSLLDLNNSILSTIQSNLTTLQQNNTNHQNDTQILQTQQLESQYQTAVNGLNQSLRTLNYQSSGSNPPGDIANIQKDITLKQLDVQEKSLDLNKEMSQIQLNIAAVNEAMMYPSTPIAGTIQKIYVREGQAITPGTPIAEIAGSSGDVTAIAYVPQNIATRITNIEPSTLTINNTTYEEMPLFVPTEATDNQLFGIVYVIPDQFVSQVADGQYIAISIPVGVANTSASDPFVPIDAIYQTQTNSYLYVVDKGVAKARQVNLGQVFGRYVEVLSGLKNGDQVILSRTVIDGDKVKVQ